MLITNFASGELSRKLNGRVDIPQYYQGCSKLQNFEIIPTGGIERRCGTKRMGKLSGPCRLIPFILDQNNNFIFEFTLNKIYIWKNGSKLIDEITETQIFIDTSYASLAEINEIHYAQDYNQMIFVQQNYKPFIVKYDFATETFSGSNMNFDFYADVQLDDDYDWVIIAGDDLPVRIERADGKLEFYDKDGNSKVTGDKAFCVYKGRLFSYNTEERLWEVYGEDPDDDELYTEGVRKLFNEAGYFPSCVSFYNNRLWLASTKNDRQKVWASCTPDSDKTRYNKFSTYKKYVTVNKVTKDADVHVFTGNILLDNVKSNETIITGLTQDFTKDGALAKDITSYYITNDTYIPVGTKVKSITDTTMTIEGDLTSLVEKDTMSIVFTIQLWISSSAASADDYEYQITVNNMTTSDCSFNFELASDQNDAVRFIGANKYLTIGTESSVWNVPANVTALNIQAEMSGRYGSDIIQGHAVGTAMIYFAQGKYGIRESYYDNNQEAFQTNNIALLADQMLTESAAIDFDFITNPYNKLIIVRADGIAVQMLYDKTNGVMGWNRIVHGDAAADIICTAITRGDREADFVYFAVKHGENYYLEKIEESQKVYLDSWSSYSGEINPDYYDYATVYNATKDKTVLFSDYTPDFIGEGDEVYIGYTFESVIKSMPIVQNDPTAKKRITNLLVRFLESHMPVMDCGENTEYFTDVEEPYSGIKQIDYPGTSERDVDFTIKTNDAKPCCILSVNANLA